MPLHHRPTPKTGLMTAVMLSNLLAIGNGKEIQKQTGMSKGDLRRVASGEFGGDFPLSALEEPYEEDLLLDQRVSGYEI